MTSTFLDWIRGLSWSDANVRGAVWTFLATLMLMFALWVVAGFFRKLRDRYEAWIEQRRTRLKLQEWEMVSGEKLQQSVRFVVGFLHFVVVILLIDVYITLVLRFFSATEALSDRYFQFFTAPLVALFRAVVAYLPDLLNILVIVLVTFVGLRFVRVLFRVIGTGAVRLPGFYRDWADPTYKIVRVLILMFALIAVFPHLPGADEQAFKAVSLFVGALVTLGSTAAVGNAVAGVVLIYTRAFQVGDWIQVGRSTGTVTQRTLLVTRLRTARDEQITVPNGEVLRDHVVNYSPAARDGRLGFNVSIRIGYDVDWRIVEKLLLEAAAATPGVLSEPRPLVLQRSFDDFGVSYLLVTRTSGPPPLGRIRDALGRNILDAFDRAGVEILTPDVSLLRSDGSFAVAQVRPSPPSD